MNTASHRFNTGDTVFIPKDDCKLSEGMFSKPYEVLELDIKVAGSGQRVTYGLIVPGYTRRTVIRMDESMVFASVQEGEKEIAVFTNAKQDIDPPSTLAKKYRRVWRDGKYIDELIKS